MSAPEDVQLLDYFAAAALTGIMADPELSMAPAQIAQHVLDIAEALLAERNRREAK